MGRVLCGASCTGEGRGLNRLQLDGGRTIQARLLVGADGANSR